MTQDEFIQYLKNLSTQHGTQKAMAQALGVSAAFLSDVLRGRRDPGGKMVAALGFRKVLTYERVK